MVKKHAALVLLAGALMAQTARREGRLPEVVSGRGEVWVADGEDGAGSSRRIRVVAEGREPVEVVLADGGSIESGEWVTVEGVREGSRLQGSRVLGRTRPPEQCPATGAQKAAVFLVYDASASPPAVAVQSIQDIFFGAAGASAGQYWRDASYSQLDLTGTVFGWRQLSKTYDFCTQYEAMLDEAMKLYARELRGAGYTRFFLASPRVRSCGWAGLSSVGCTMLGANDRMLGSASYLALDYPLDRTQGVTLAAHEGGHQLGLDHSSTLRFGAEALGPPSTYGSLDEYGDPYSAMGWWNQGQYAAPMKARLGWIAAGMGYQTVEATGSYTLVPYSANPGGLRALRIRRIAGSDAWLWVEYRPPMGALVHYERWSDPRSLLLDFAPASGSWGDAALSAGQAWADPYSNLTIRVNGTSATGLSLTVEYR